MKIFRTIFTILLASLMIASGYSAYIFYDISYNDSRFEPADKLHSTCVQTMIVGLQNNDPIEDLHLNLIFNPQDLQIIRLVPKKEYKESFNSKFSYDSLSINIKNLYEQGDLDLFEMYFRSELGADSSKIELGADSYYIVDGEKKKFGDSSIVLEFASVIECEPDVLPPSISLVHPKKINDILPLDSYFVFEFKDLGKGINKNSLSIQFEGITHSGNDSSLKWSGNRVFLYPNERLPINSEIGIKVIIADNQKYGGANKIEKSFNFQSASGLLFENPVNPDKFRNISQGLTLLRADDSECKLLQSLYNKSDIYYKFRLKKILKKMSCEIPKNNIENIALNIEESSNELEIKLKPSSKAFSVFAILGWILFIVTLVLKLHYLHHYRKHKRAIKKNQ